MTRRPTLVAERVQTQVKAGLLLTVEEAASLLRISRNLCYELIRQHQIPSLRLGRLIRVPRYALEAWLGQQAGETALMGPPADKLAH
jgi:excisionase family DNA binding protein